VRKRRERERAGRPAPRCGARTRSGRCGLPAGDEFDRQASDARLADHERRRARARSDEIRAKGPKFLQTPLGPADLESPPLMPPGTAEALRQEARGLID
jgi:hypothetical protein